MMPPDDRSGKAGMNAAEPEGMQILDPFGNRQAENFKEGEAVPENTLTGAAQRLRAIEANAS